MCILQGTATATDCRPQASSSTQSWWSGNTWIRHRTRTTRRYSPCTQITLPREVVYTLICEPLDNPLLASSFLTLFVHEVGPLAESETRASLSQFGNLAVERPLPQGSEEVVLGRQDSKAAFCAVGGWEPGG